MSHAKVIPEINCTVVQCAYNTKEKCAAEYIQVSEKSSSSADCITYKPKNSR
ncbi:MAG: DUF1540 domain-containing protein [Eubacteriales bacterium]|jgi:hypothetical protein|nr:DUF1540 domain-containing protein [Eubacteriales bacterium]